MGNLFLKKQNTKMEGTAKQKAEQMIKDNKVMFFSKSYSPFAGRAKTLMKSKGIEMKVYELDQEADGQAIQDALKDMSGQRTVPNVYINGAHLGGCDECHAAAANGKLKQMCDAAGVANTC